MTEKDELVLIFTGSAIEAGMVKDNLEHEGIIPLLKDEMHESIASGRATPDTEHAVKLFVIRSDYEKASQVVQQYVPQKNATDIRSETNR